MIKPLKCPVCNNLPTLIKNPLWRGSHGYHDCYSIKYECNGCGLLKPFGSESIYHSEEEAISEACKLWNKEVKRIKSIMKSERELND